MDMQNTQTGTAHSPYISDVTDDTFAAEVKQHAGFILVDMWADWCTPCHMLAPHLDKIAGYLPGKLKIVKMDVDNNQRTAIEYNVMGLPTMLLFQDGVVVGQMVGFRSERQITDWLKDKGVDIIPVEAPAMPATPNPEPMAM
jgi:thioredoxin 1